VTFLSSFVFWILCHLHVRLHRTTHRVLFAQQLCIWYCNQKYLGFYPAGIWHTILDDVTTTSSLTSGSDNAVTQPVIPEENPQLNASETWKLTSSVYKLGSNHTTTRQHWTLSLHKARHGFSVYTLEQVKHLAFSLLQDVLPNDASRILYSILENLAWCTLKAGKHIAHKIYSTRHLWNTHTHTSIYTSDFNNMLEMLITN